MNKHLHADIESWAEAKLAQWARDVAMRCEIVDGGEDAGPIIAASAAHMAASFLAAAGMSPETAGNLFAETVRAVRRIQVKAGG